MSIQDIEFKIKEVIRSAIAKYYRPPEDYLSEQLSKALGYTVEVWYEDTSRMYIYVSGIIKTNDHIYKFRVWLPRPPFTEKDVIETLRNMISPKTFLIQRWK